MNEIDEKLAQARARGEQQLEATLLRQLSLPFWSEEQRGVPNGLLRSAIFAAIRRGKPIFLRREKLASLEGTSIIYTGIRLSQDYLTLWECLVHAARAQQLGNRCEVSTYQLLKLMNKVDTGGNRKVLYRMLAELQATAIEIKQGRYVYTGSLVEEAFRDDQAQRIVIVLNPRMVALFQSDQFTKVSWDIRQALKKPLAMWLHGFYSTHAKPFAYSTAKIHELCGSDAKSVKKFTEDTLEPALEELASVSRRHGEHFAYAVIGRLVHVSRSPAIALPKLNLPNCG